MPKLDVTSPSTAALHYYSRLSRYADQWTVFTISFLERNLVPTTTPASCVSLTSAIERTARMIGFWWLLPIEMSKYYRTATWSLSSGSMPGYAA